MRVRTFVSDLLEQLLNRHVSRLIFQDDQNLRLGIARRVSAGSRGRGGAREVTGKSLFRYERKLRPSSPDLGDAR